MRRPNFARGLVFVALCSITSCQPENPVDPAIEVRDLSVADADHLALSSFEDAEWSAPVNIGAPVNSPHFEQNPALSRDELSLYFSSDRPGGFGGQDMWVSRRASLHDPWEQPINLGATINGPGVDGAPSLSNDGHLLFFTSNRPGGHGGQDIWMASRTDTHDDLAWESPVNVGSAVNSANGESASTYLQSGEDGVTNFYFTRNVPGLERDIYSAAMRRDGKDRGPVALVSELNVAGVPDAVPTLRRDGREVFFWSTRPGSLVSDIWTSTRRSVHDAWSTPINAGASLNSASADATPNLSFDGRTLVFLSSRPGGLGGTDIWIATRDTRPTH